MKDKIFLTICLAAFGIMVPVLEIGSTHLLSPRWPGHAHLHEAWQLFTNCGFAALAFWLVWFRNQFWLASVNAAIMAWGFLASYLLRGLYGGSMMQADGSELTFGGFNSPVIVMSAVAVPPQCLWHRFEVVI